MKRFRIYPLRSAMHGAAQFWTRRWGWVCFKPPTYAFGRWWPAYFYLSPNATPWAATLHIGAGVPKRRTAAARRLLWGHNFDTDKHWRAAQLACSALNALADAGPRREAMLGAIETGYAEPSEVAG